MYWDDTRLSWNESAYGGISTVYIFLGDLIRWSRG